MPKASFTITPGVNKRHQSAQTHSSRLGGLAQHIPKCSLQCDAGPMAGECETAFDQATQRLPPALSDRNDTGVFSGGINADDAEFNGSMRDWQRLVLAATQLGAEDVRLRH